MIFSLKLGARRSALYIISKLPIQGICLMRNELALLFPQWRKSVSLLGYLLLESSSMKTKLNSHIKKDELVPFNISKFVKF